MCQCGGREEEKGIIHGSLLVISQWKMVAAL